jgi:hypothetical protein
VSPYRWQRSNEAVQMTMILIEVICKQLQNKFLLIYDKNIKKEYSGKINLALVKV